jgi:hypothetical protein
MNKHISSFSRGKDKPKFRFGMANWLRTHREEILFMLLAGRIVELESQADP